MYDIDKVDKSLWRTFVVAVQACRILEAKKRHQWRNNFLKKRLNILFKLNRGAYYSEKLVAPGDSSGLTGIISAQTKMNMMDAGLINHKDWTIDTTLHKRIKKEKFYQDVEIRLAQLAARDTKDKT